MYCKLSKRTAVFTLTLIMLMGIFNCTILARASAGIPRAVSDTSVAILDMSAELLAPQSYKLVLTVNDAAAEADAGVVIAYTADEKQVVTADNIQNSSVVRVAVRSKLSELTVEEAEADVEINEAAEVNETEDVAEAEEHRYSVVVNTPFHGKCDVYAVLLSGSHVTEVSKASLPVWLPSPPTARRIIVLSTPTPKPQGTPQPTYRPNNMYWWTYSWFASPSPSPSPSPTPNPALPKPSLRPTASPAPSVMAPAAAATPTAAVTP